MVFVEKLDDSSVPVQLPSTNGSGAERSGGEGGVGVGVGVGDTGEGVGLGDGEEPPAQLVARDAPDRSVSSRTNADAVS